MSATLNPLQPVVRPCPDWCDQRADHSSWDDDPLGLPVRHHEHRVGTVRAMDYGTRAEVAVTVSVVAPERAGSEPVAPMLWLDAGNRQLVLTLDNVVDLSAHMARGMAQILDLTGWPSGTAADSDEADQ